jgi:ribosomal protein S18 acetylase RimI-like enzyme
MISIHPAEPGDIPVLARGMRPWDVRECAVFGFSPERALRYSLSGSLMAWTARLDGEPIAMFGCAVVSLIEGTGRPWMLGTEAIYRQGRALVRLAPGYVGQMRERFPRMDNLLHQDNDRALRLLRRLGFQIEPEARDVGGEPMVRFFSEP